MNPDIGPNEMLQGELHSVIHRYAQESDVSIAAAIGVLELVKDELLDYMRTARDEDED